MIRFPPFPKQNGIFLGLCFVIPLTCFWKYNVNNEDDEEEKCGV